jgi:hypothetical protein
MHYSYNNLGPLIETSPTALSGSLATAVSAAGDANNVPDFAPEQAVIAAAIPCRAPGPGSICAWMRPWKSLMRKYNNPADSRPSSRVRVQRRLCLAGCRRAPPLQADLGPGMARAAYRGATGRCHAAKQNNKLRATRQSRRRISHAGRTDRPRGLRHRVLQSIVAVLCLTKGNECAPSFCPPC